MAPVFTGSGVALVTPFEKDGTINFRKFNELIEYQISNKTDAVIVCGTTGEGSTLCVEERLLLFSDAVKTSAHRVPVIGGTGSNSTSYTLSIATQSEKCGIDAHLMVTPYYNKTSQKGLVEHYYFLADRLSKPIIVYNVPSRTGMNIQPETYKELSKHPNIVAVKEADTNIVKIMKSVALCENNLDFYTGNDDMISVTSSFGCKGVISVISNILPEITHQMAKYGVDGEMKKCSDIQKTLLDLIECLFSDINPIPVKEAMNILGFDVGGYRLPLCEMSKKKRGKLIECLNRHYELFM